MAQVSCGGEGNGAQFSLTEQLDSAVGLSEHSAAEISELTTDAPVPLHLDLLGQFRKTAVRKTMSMDPPSSRRKTTSTSAAPHRQPSTRHAPNPFGDPPAVPTHRPTRGHTTPARPVPSTTTRHVHPSPSTTSHSKRPHKSRDHMDNVVVKNGVPLDRVKPNRSMTTGPAPVPPAPSRTLSTDNVDRQNDRARKPSPRPPSKKSTHVDVIDKLDYSGIGSATFHHDGPFDACAPSRNRNKTKAPMNAFDDVPLQQADANNKNLSPLAQATILAMKQSPGSSPYAVTVNTGVSSSYGQPPSPTYASPKKKSPKKSALAEAWGIAEPEPFEEFSAGRHSAYDTPPTGSHTSINNTATRTGMTTRADPFPEYSDSRPQPARRPSRALPPPQPIQLYPEFPEGDPVPMSMAPSSYGQRPGAPKRSKSLMQRFRKMRDSPNAPPPAAYEEEAPPPTEVRLVTPRAPPVPERSPVDPYMPRDKNLPPPPPVANADYFDGQHAAGNGGINRKGSLMRKMKGVMSR